MILLLTALLGCALVALAFLLFAGGSMVRNREIAEKVDELRSVLETTRNDIEREREKALELRNGAIAVNRKVIELERKETALSDEVERMPEERFELIFEIGEEQEGSSIFEFFVRRSQKPRTSGVAQEVTVRNAEVRLWSAPRNLRVRARTMSAATAAALTKFPKLHGFMIVPKREAFTFARAGGDEL